MTTGLSGYRSKAEHEFYTVDSALQAKTMGKLPTLQANLKLIEKPHEPSIYPPLLLFLLRLMNIMANSKYRLLPDHSRAYVGVSEARVSYRHY